MTVVLLTTAGSGTWNPPTSGATACPAGTVLTIECWGAGGGGASVSSGRSGGGGAYCVGTYTVT